MATPNEKLATSLTALRELQKGVRRVFQSRELSRFHRERLLQNGVAQEVMADLSQSGCARRRQHAVVRLLLGVLRDLLWPAFWKRLVPVS